MVQSKPEKARKIRDDLEMFLDNSLKDSNRVILPCNLSSTFLLENKPDGIKETKWLSGCHYIVNTIVQMSADKRYLKGKISSYVPLYSVILIRICGNDYKKVFIQNLIRLGIVDCDGIYSILKHESFGFRLSKLYRGQPYKYRFIKDLSVINSIKKHRSKQLVELKERIRPIAHLARWSFDTKLKIDKTEALDYLEYYRLRMVKEVGKRNLLPQFRADQDSFISTRYYRGVHQVETWGTSPTLTVDDAGGRLYTQVTGLMSPLRHFLTYDGQPLVSFDLKNSQPLHFLLLLHPKFWKKRTTGLSLWNADKDIYQLLIDRYTSPSIMYQEIAETFAGRGSNFPSFAFLIKNGKLYEFISNLFFQNCENKNDANRFCTRNKTKGEFLKLMYFNPMEPFSSSHQPFKIFENKFPLEAKLMNILKEDDYRNFSVLLQKIEALILLHNVCQEVYDISPDIPLFTVHDSIITTEKYADLLKGVIEKTYFNLLGFIPPMKREELNPQQADAERLKYIKSKIDQAEIEVTEANPPSNLLFPFLKCENWNIDRELKKIVEKTHKDYSAKTDTLKINLPDLSLISNLVDPFTKNKRNLKKLIESD